MLRFILPFFMAVFFPFFPAHAANTDIESYTKELISLNKNIGTYYFIGDHIQENIADSDNQQIGTVQDFLINSRGEVEQLVGDLNTMAFGDQILNIAYEEIDRAESSYQVAYKAAEMEEHLATWLASIETASGEESEGLVSARRLHGREILLPTGESIGEVERVITDKETRKVVGVLIKDMLTRPEHERIALPYPNGLRIKNTGLSNDLELAEEYVEVVQQFTAEGIPD